MTVAGTTKCNTPSESRAYASQYRQHLMRNVNTNTLAFIELKKLHQHIGKRTMYWWKGRHIWQNETCNQFTNISPSETLRLEKMN